ncbi:MAG TPA: hypothetical protein VFP72_18570 [Kineosporiaceae bacterium]|nr:hypothetical protein [Kineosporiaceae bacterium]
MDEGFDGALAVAAVGLLTAFVTYDKRLAGTARQTGLPVAMPGQTP